MGQWVLPHDVGAAFLRVSVDVGLQTPTDFEKAIRPNRDVGAGQGQPIHPLYPHLPCGGSAVSMGVCWGLTDPLTHTPLCDI